MRIRALITALGLNAHSGRRWFGANGRRDHAGALLAGNAHWHLACRLRIVLHRRLRPSEDIGLSRAAGTEAALHWPLSYLTAFLVPALVFTVAMESFSPSGA